MDTESSTHNEGNRQEMPRLGETTAENVAASTSLSISGVPPLLGGLFGLLARKIDSERLGRIESYAKRLYSMCKDLEKICLSNQAKLNLLEEGANHTTRAYSEERIKHIASIVANGLSGKEKEEAEARRMLKVLAEMEDDQVIVLTSYLRKNKRNKEFYNKHAEVLETKRNYLGGGTTRADESVMQRTAKQHLVRLELLQSTFKKPTEGEIPEFDLKTGMLKASGYQLTWLGSMLLRYLGLAKPGEL